ncbi:hypothetical protein ACWDHW_13670 [Streptomyces melanosporofaciens]|uniref:hypothetical protein n=1 Tax=unclassified Streptomyces TaxID=2593676 RepID=UPI003688B94C
MRMTKTAALLWATAALSLALTACGGGSGVKTDKGVDSIDSQAPAAGGKADTDRRGGKKDVTADRPQLRLDSSQEERDRLGDAYNACLEAHGVPMNHERAKLAGAKQASPVQDPAVVKKHQAGYDACLVKLPRQPPETEPETNPHFADDYRAYVKCLNKHGMRVHMVSDTSVSPDGLAWRYDDGEQRQLSDAEETKVDRACELAAFSD